MTVEQTLQTEIDESRRWLDREHDDSTYKRDLVKRIELINWVLENIKNANVQICGIVETRMNEIIQSDIDAIDRDIEATDRDIEATKKNLEEGLRRRVEAVKKGIKDRKDELKQRVERAKQKPKDHAREEAEKALNSMEKNLTEGDLVSAHIDRWIANQWLKASK